MSAEEMAESRRVGVSRLRLSARWRALSRKRRENHMTLQERCATIRLLLLDVDGVLTDGSIIYTDTGAEAKAFHVRDGSGLKFWERAGKKAGIVTGRTSGVVVAGPPIWILRSWFRARATRRRSCAKS